MITKFSVLATESSIESPEAIERQRFPRININFDSVQSKGDKISVAYSYAADYYEGDSIDARKLGHIKLSGIVEVTETIDAVSSIMKTWKENKILPIRLAEEIINGLTFRCSAAGTLIAYSQGLIPPMIVSTSKLQESDAPNKQALEKLTHEIPVTSDAGITNLLPAMEFLTPKSKTDPDLLIGRSDDIEELIQFVKSETSLLVIRGPKRYGKTSLALSFLNIASQQDHFGYSLEGEFVPMYVTLDGLQSLDDLKAAIETSMEKTRNLLKVDEWPKNVKKFSKALEDFRVVERHHSIRVPIPIPIVPLNIGYERQKKVEPAYRELGIRGLLEYISKTLQDGEKLIIVVDEVQRISTNFSPKEQDIFLQDLKLVNDDLSNVKIILTGAVAGVRDILKRQARDYELTGRIIAEVPLRPLSASESVEFLRRAFDEGKIDVDESTLDLGATGTHGVPGWLTIFATRFIKSVVATPTSDQPTLAQRIISDLQPEVQRTLSNEMTSFVRSGGEKYAEVVDYIRRAKAETVRTSELIQKFQVSGQELVDIFTDLEEIGVAQQVKDGIRVTEEAAHGLKTARYCWSLGNRLFEKNKFQEAVEEYDEAIRQNPEFADAYFDRGLARQIVGQNSARADFETTIKLEPESADAMHMIGKMEQDLGNLEDAEKWFKEALEKRSDFADSRIALSDLLATKAKEQVEKRNLEQAKKLYERALELDNTNADLWDRLGSCFAKLGEFKRSIEMHDKAIQLAPDEPVYHNNRAYHLALSHQFADAIVEIDTTVRNHRNEPFLWGTYSEVLALAGHSDAGIKKLESCVSDGTVKLQDMCQQIAKEIDDSHNLGLTENEITMLREFQRLHCPDASQPKSG